eukprot:CAMPEP_0115710906 /NCGR_PEP_ID=MMETSP0272-20121206/73274_1 /TAXON_ID=71861 /ORGANISM="Scrippsiella trochoidea, Strain CCMP3099" /LENGTH=32 /DNA_ID= /DNA_START= /DNA_END= /DNA_ORIENTATION=
MPVHIDGMHGYATPPKNLAMNLPHRFVQIQQG